MSKSISEIAKVGAGQGAPQDVFAFSNDGTPFVRAGSLEFLCKGVSLNKLERINERQAKVYGLKLYPAGTILFAKSGMSAVQNRVYVLPEPAYVVSHLATIEVKNGVDPKFLGYFWQDFKTSRLIQDPAYPSISLEAIGNVEIELPKLAEQKRIATILDKADRLRRQRRFAQTLSDSFLQSVFAKMFDFDKYKSFPLIDLAMKRQGSFVNGPFGSDLLTTELTSKGVPVIYVRDIKEHGYERISKVCVTEEKASQLSSCSVESGDVLIAKVGNPPGIASVYPETQPKAIITQDVIRIKPDTERISPEFLSVYLNSSKGKRGLYKIIIEGTRERFSLTDYKQLDVPVPPLPLQEHFAAIVQQFERIRRQQREATRQAERLFQTLLHRAFRGDL